MGAVKERLIADAEQLATTAGLDFDQALHRLMTMREPLDAFGPLRETHVRGECGERVMFPWAGAVLTGTILGIGAPFNGVEGIHAYATVRADGGSEEYPVKVDELRPCGDLTTSVPDRLW